MYPCHPQPLCDQRRPCWLRSGRFCMTPPEPLPFGPAAAANAPLPGMLQRAVRFALPSPQRTPAPSLSFSCAWALALLPPEAAQKIRGIQQSPAGRQEDLRSSASASARLAPWKGHRRCTLDPAPSAAIRPRARATQSTWCTSHKLQFCSPELDPLRSRLDPLDRE